MKKILRIIAIWFGFGIIFSAINAELWKRSENSYAPISFNISCGFNCSLVSGLSYTLMPIVSVPASLYSWASGKSVPILFYKDESHFKSYGPEEEEK